MSIETTELSFTIAELGQLISSTLFEPGDIIVIKFRPGTDRALSEALNSMQHEDAVVISTPEYLFPGVEVADPNGPKHIVALFPSEWPCFHQLIESYCDTPSGVLYLIDNSLAAHNYADAVFSLDVEALEV